MSLKTKFKKKFPILEIRISLLKFGSLKLLENLRKHVHK